MDELERLTFFVSRVVFDSTFRSQYLLNPTTVLDEIQLPIDMVKYLNADDLVQVGRAIDRGIRTGSLGGVSLESTYRQTLRILGLNVSDFISAIFLRDSQAVDAVGVGIGMSVLEACYRALARVVWEDDHLLCTLQKEFVSEFASIESRSHGSHFTSFSYLVGKNNSSFLGIVDCKVGLRSIDDVPLNPFVFVLANGVLRSGKLSTLAVALLADDYGIGGWTESVIRQSNNSSVAKYSKLLSESGLR